MNNQQLYYNLLKEITGNLNFKEIQELKSLRKENIPLLKKKIQKLKKNIRIAQIAMISILFLIMIFSFIIQMDILPKLHHYFIMLLMYFPISLGPIVFGKSSLTNSQRTLDIFELMLVLTKNEIPVKEI